MSLIKEKTIRLECFANELGFDGFGVTKPRSASGIERYKEPPKNKIRKVIFKDGCGLSISEKLRIVGSLIGRIKKINNKSLYNAMLDVNHKDLPITITLLANMLKCSTRTIHRNMCNELKLEKQRLNTELHEKI